MWVLRLEPESSVRAARALNHWVTSSASPTFFFFFETVLLAEFGVRLASEPLRPSWLCLLVLKLQTHGCHAQLFAWCAGHAIQVLMCTWLALF